MQHQIAGETCSDRVAAYGGGTTGEVVPGRIEVGVATGCLHFVADETGIVVGVLHLYYI